MWARAVWLEKDREEEGDVPFSWIKEKVLYWPPGVNVEKAMSEKRVPNKQWRKFQIVKIKMKSENRYECEDATTAVDDGSDEDDAKRRKKRKTFQDFITARTVLSEPPGKVAVISNRKQRTASLSPTIGRSRSENGSDMSSSPSRHSRSNSREKRPRSALGIENYESFSERSRSHQSTKSFSRSRSRSISQRHDTRKNSRSSKSSVRFYRSRSKSHNESDTRSFSTSSIRPHSYSKPKRSENLHQSRSRSPLSRSQLKVKLKDYIPFPSYSTTYNKIKIKG